MPRRVFFAAAVVCILCLPATSYAMNVSPLMVASQTGKSSKKIALARPANEIVKKTTKLLDSVSSTMSGVQGRFEWPVKERTINTSFGGGHDGVDIEGETGDEIVAARSGRIIFAGDDGDGYGTKILIDHGRGIRTLYSHLNQMTKRHGWVEAGDKVGTVGCTGSCSGDHLHFEILDHERPLNPVDYLPKS
jgi:murein DD-endopeptidase MepM/ murein hydrolase activator NlpD